MENLRFFVSSPLGTMVVNGGNCENACASNTIVYYTFYSYSKLQSHGLIRFAAATSDLGYIHCKIMYLNYNRIMQETVIKVANLIIVTHTHTQREKEREKSIFAFTRAFTKAMPITG